MNLEEIFRESLNDLKSKYEIPKSGFLSGGSIANIIWEKVSGNKAKINDIDIYILDRVIDKVEEDEFRKKQSYKRREKIIYEDYSGICIGSMLTSFYLIEEVRNEGILNFINYSANKNDPQIIIESFDINCCQVGYDISTDKFYWTKEFEEFLKTGELKLISLNSPSHSAMRLVKKQIDLNAKLPELELDIIAYTLENNFFEDTVKHRFMQRYADMFEKYKFALDSRFEILRDVDLEDFLVKSKNVDDKMYYLKSKDKRLQINDSQKVGLTLSRDFLFWVRNIFSNHELEKIWFNTYLIFDTKLGIENYLDCRPSENELHLLNRLTHKADCARHLTGFPLSRQVYIVNTLFDKFKHDPIIAISILETICIDYTINLDDELELLLLELSVRKKILDDPRGKVSNIIYNEDKSHTSESHFPEFIF